MMAMCLLKIVGMRDTLAVGVTNALLQECFGRNNSKERTYFDHTALLWRSFAFQVERALFTTQTLEEKHFVYYINYTRQSWTLHTLR